MSLLQLSSAFLTSSLVPLVKRLSPPKPSPCLSHYSRALGYYVAAALCPACWHSRTPLLGPRIAQRGVISSEPAEKYAFLIRKNEKIPYKGGICEQYDGFGGNHPDLFALRSLDALLVWGITPNEKPHC
jgi:hypothetical protein